MKKLGCDQVLRKSSADPSRNGKVDIALQLSWVEAKEPGLYTLALIALWIRSFRIGVWPWARRFSSTEAIPGQGAELWAAFPEAGEIEQILHSRRMMHDSIYYKQHSKVTPLIWSGAKNQTHFYWIIHCKAYWWYWQSLPSNSLINPAPIFSLAPSALHMHREC